MLDAARRSTRLDPLGADYVHLASRRPSRRSAIRDRHITDPAYMTVDAQSFLAAGEARRARGAASTATARRRGAQGKRPGRHDLDGRDRRRRPRGELHPERLSRVRLRRRAEVERRSAGRTAAARSASIASALNALEPRPQAVPHAQPGAGAARRTAARWSTATWAATASRRRRARCSRARSCTA